MRLTKRSLPGSRPRAAGHAGSVLVLACLPYLPCLPMAALVAESGLGAQEPTSRTQVEEEIDVTEVLIDVLVTDRDGNVILGLQPEDFIVEEEGVAVELTGVSFYSNRRNLDEAAPDPPNREEAEVPSERYFVLFFHDLTRDATFLVSRHVRARRDIQEWLRTQFLPTDRAAVLSYDYKLKVHQDFTSDRGQLVEAVARAARGKDPGDNWPSRREEIQGPSLLRNLPQGKKLGKKTRRFFDAVRLVSDATRTIPTRKIFLLFSPGFEGDVLTGGGYRPDPRYYPDMMQSLNASNTAVYSLDLMPVGAQHALSDSLHLLSYDTGGRYYQNLLSFTNPLGLISDENSGYYLLSYRSESPRGESGYRQVRVRLRNKEFRVRGREGFLYGPSEPEGGDDAGR